MWIAKLRRIFDLIRAYFYNANTEFVKDIWITDVVIWIVLSVFLV